LFDEINAFSWILLAVVLISLALSIVSLITQIKRKLAQKHAPMPKTKDNPWDSAMSTPVRQPEPKVWSPSVQEIIHDNTVALFPSDFSTPSSAVFGHTEQLKDDGYHISIRETSPAGERTYDITVNGEFSVGRSPANNLQISDPTVSGVQCTFTVGASEVFVRNSSKSNITQLNGMKLTDKRPLKSGDTLRLGKIQITFMNIRKHAAR